MSTGSNGITVFVSAVYRATNWLDCRGLSRPARLLLVLAKTITGVEIELGAKLAPDFIIHHGQGIVIGRGVVTGSRCHFFHQITLGSRPGGYPTLGDRVTVCAGAKVLGPITIGDDAVIGANAVVITDVPAGCTAVGVPARILPRPEEHPGVAELG